MRQCQCSEIEHKVRARQHSRTVPVWPADQQRHLRAAIITLFAKMRRKTGRRQRPPRFIKNNHARRISGSCEQSRSLVGLAIKHRRSPAFRQLNKTNASNAQLAASGLKTFPMLDVYYD